MKKLAIDMPSAELVEGYLAEIARGYGIRWNSDPKPIGDGQLGDAQGLVVGGLSILQLWVHTESLVLTRTELQRLQGT
jgi:hypothetical protein